MPRIAARLKIVTGTYSLQTTRAAFNHNAVNHTCLACNEDNETSQHFLLDCSALQSCREPVMHQIIQLCGENDIEFDTVDSLQPVIDSSNCCVIPDKLYADFKKLTRLLCYNLQTER